MRSLLVVSPHFPPINAPDHQRVRMAVPYLEQCGWQPTVLAVKPEGVEGVVEPLLAQALPTGLRVVRTDALSVAWTRRIGVGSLAYRAGRYLKQAGDDLLGHTKFDLVFISTTIFPTMALGPRWQKMFNVPYVLDFQDPWVSDYYLQRPQQRPPGGRLKHRFSRWLAKRLEPQAVRGAGHTVCVSSAYSDSFLRRYPDLTADRFTTLPFGAPEADFAALEELKIQQTVFDPHDGREHWVYIGRGGQDMAFALRAFFLALRRHLDEKPEQREHLRIHFVGTDYAPKHRARKTIEPLAIEHGVGQVVSEETNRLPYFETLRCLRDADALIIPGSDDPGYTASKLYPYILAKKPLLAVFHETSSVVDVLRRTGAGKVVTFGGEKALREVADDIYQRWFDSWPLPAPSTDWNAFEPYTAREMTRRLCAVFDSAVA